MKQTLLLFLFCCLSANAQQKFTVYFDTDKDVANEKSSQQFSEWLEANKDAEIQQIAAYTDTVGNARYNDTLSAKRFTYVYAKLLSNNIALEKIKVSLLGERESLTGTNAQNRRAVITYTKPVDPNSLTGKLNNAKVGDRIVLKDIYFRGGTTYILKESRPALNELLNAMKSNPKLKIDIQGHICCDIEDVGDLSGKRADEVFLYLTNNGVDKNRVTTRGYGGHRPIHKIPELNDNEMAENRRVEIEIISN